jgi:hypothetical protein
MSANQAVNQERVVKVLNGAAMLVIWIVAAGRWCSAGFLSTKSGDMGRDLRRSGNGRAHYLCEGIFHAAAQRSARAGSLRLLVDRASKRFHWGNPFYTNGPSQFGLAAAQSQIRLRKTGAGGRPGRNKISLRARTLNGDTLKVNDKRGNPIEIAAVVVWRVQDTAQAMFDVDDYENYVPRRANRPCATWRASTHTTATLAR